jgi:hypothetical protein
MTPVHQLEGADYDVVAATIADEASLSDVATVDAGQIVGISFPTIVSAALSFQVSYDGSTFRDLYDSDGTTETKTTASTGNRVIAAPAALKEAGAVAVKVRSGLTAAVVTQTSGPIVFSLLLRRLNP